MEALIPESRTQDYPKVPDSTRGYSIGVKYNDHSQLELKPGTGAYVCLWPGYNSSGFINLKNSIGMDPEYVAQLPLNLYLNSSNLLNNGSNIFAGNEWTICPEEWRVISQNMFIKKIAEGGSVSARGIRFDTRTFFRRHVVVTKRGLSYYVLPRAWIRQQDWTNDPTFSSNDVTFEERHAECHLEHHWWPWLKPPCCLVKLDTSPSAPLEPGDNGTGIPDDVIEPEDPDGDAGPLGPDDPNDPNSVPIPPVPITDDDEEDEEDMDQPDNTGGPKPKPDEVLDPTEDPTEGDDDPMSDPVEPPEVGMIVPPPGIVNNIFPDAKDEDDNWKPTIVQVPDVDPKSQIPFGEDGLLDPTSVPCGDPEGPPEDITYPNIRVDSEWIEPNENLYSPENMYSETEDLLSQLMDLRDRYLQENTDTNPAEVCGAIPQARNQMYAQDLANHMVVGNHASSNFHVFPDYRTGDVDPNGDTITNLVDLSTSAQRRDYWGFTGISAESVMPNGVDIVASYEAEMNAYIANGNAPVAGGATGHFEFLINPAYTHIGIGSNAGNVIIVHSDETPIGVNEMLPEVTDWVVEPDPFIFPFKRQPNVHVGPRVRSHARTSRKVQEAKGVNCPGMPAKPVDWVQYTDAELREYLEYEQSQGTDDFDGGINGKPVYRFQEKNQVVPDYYQPRDRNIPYEPGYHPGYIGSEPQTNIAACGPNGPDPDFVYPESYFPGGGALVVPDMPDGYFNLRENPNPEQEYDLQPTEYSGLQPEQQFQHPSICNESPLPSLVPPYNDEFREPTEQMKEYYKFATDNRTGSLASYSTCVNRLFFAIALYDAKYGSLVTPPGPSFTPAGDSLIVDYYATCIAAISDSNFDCMAYRDPYGIPFPDNDSFLAYNFYVFARQERWTIDSDWLALQSNEKFFFQGCYGASPVNYNWSVIPTFTSGNIKSFLFPVGVLNPNAVQSRNVNAAISKNAWVLSPPVAAFDPNIFENYVFNNNFPRLEFPMKIPPCIWFTGYAYEPYEYIRVYAETYHKNFCFENAYDYELYLNKYYHDHCKINPADPENPGGYVPTWPTDFPTVPFVEDDWAGTSMPGEIDNIIADYVLTHPLPDGFESPGSYIDHLQNMYEDNTHQTTESPYDEICPNQFPNFSKDYYLGETAVNPQLNTYEGESPKVFGFGPISKVPPGFPPYADRYNAIPITITDNKVINSNFFDLTVNHQNTSRIDSDFWKAQYSLLEYQYRDQPSIRSIHDSDLKAFAKSNLCLDGSVSEYGRSALEYQWRLDVVDGTASETYYDGIVNGSNANVTLEHPSWWTNSESYLHRKVDFTPKDVSGGQVNTVHGLSPTTELFGPIPMVPPGFPPYADYMYTDFRDTNLQDVDAMYFRGDTSYLASLQVVRWNPFGDGTCTPAVLAAVDLEVWRQRDNPNRSKYDALFESTSWGADCINPCLAGGNPNDGGPWPVFDIFGYQSGHPYIYFYRWFRLNRHLLDDTRYDGIVNGANANVTLEHPTWWSENLNLMLPRIYGGFSRLTHVATSGFLGCFGTNQVIINGLGYGYPGVNYPLPNGMTENDFFQLTQTEAFNYGLNSDVTEDPYGKGWEPDSKAIYFKALNWYGSTKNYWKEDLKLNTFVHLRNQTEEDHHRLVHNQYSRLSEDSILPVPSGFDFENSNASEFIDEVGDPFNENWDDEDKLMYLESIIGVNTIDIVDYQETEEGEEIVTETRSRVPYNFWQLDPIELYTVPNTYRGIVAQNYWFGGNLQKVPVGVVPLPQWEEFWGIPNEALCVGTFSAYNYPWGHTNYLNSRYDPPLAGAWKVIAYLFEWMFRDQPVGRTQHDEFILANSKSTYLASTMHNRLQIFNYVFATTQNKSAFYDWRRNIVPTYGDTYFDNFTGPYGNRSGELIDDTNWWMTSTKRSPGERKVDHSPSPVEGDHWTFPISNSYRIFTKGYLWRGLVLNDIGMEFILEPLFRVPQSESQTPEALADAGPDIYNKGWTRDDDLAYYEALIFFEWDLKNYWYRPAKEIVNDPSNPSTNVLQPPSCMNMFEWADYLNNNADDAPLTAVYGESPFPGETSSAQLMTQFYYTRNTPSAHCVETYEGLGGSLQGVFDNYDAYGYASREDFVRHEELLIGGLERGFNGMDDMPWPYWNPTKYGCPDFQNGSEIVLLPPVTDRDGDGDTPMPEPSDPMDEGSSYIPGSDGTIINPDGTIDSEQNGSDIDSAYFSDSSIVDCLASSSYYPYVDTPMVYLFNSGVESALLDVKFVTNREYTIVPTTKAEIYQTYNTLNKPSRLHNIRKRLLEKSNKTLTNVN